MYIYIYICICIYINYNLFKIYTCNESAYRLTQKLPADVGSRLTGRRTLVSLRVTLSQCVIDVLSLVWLQT